jgi:phage terminase large subunit-like protein
LEALWDEAFPSDPPWNWAKNAVPAKRAFQSDLLLVAAKGAEILGSVMAGYHGHRDWFCSLELRE